MSYYRLGDDAVLDALYEAVDGDGWALARDVQDVLVRRGIECTAAEAAWKLRALTKTGQVERGPDFQLGDRSVAGWGLSEQSAEAVVACRDRVPQGSFPQFPEQSREE